MLTLAFNIQPVKAEPRTWTVDDDGPADFHTIGEAAAAAASFDTIYVKCGTYTGFVKTSAEGLSYVGEDVQKVLLNGGFDLMELGTNVHINGFTIQGGGGWTGAGISFTTLIFPDRFYGSISGNIIKNCQTAFHFELIALGCPCPCMDIYDNIIINNEQIGTAYFEMGGFISPVIFFHNNFIDNGASEPPSFPPIFDRSIVFWDNGYPSGGNYWSSYVGEDLFSGPAQDIAGSDGIGDTPWGEDHYPLMHPWGLSELTITSLPITGVPFIIDGVSRTTPFTSLLPEGSHVLEMPQTYNAYQWSHWLEDGDTNRIKTIYLHGTTWTGVYVPTGPLTPPVGGEWVPIDKLQLLTPWTYWGLFATVVAVAFVFVKRTRKKQN
jgi:hypothetical protein